jgi:dihydropteroate synthase
MVYLQKQCIKVAMTQLVGILNLTPDSFSDGGQYNTTEVALRRAAQLFSDGASLVDVGAESTRPGATPLSDAEEWARLEPVLLPLMEEYPGALSLDTYHPETARRALEQGKVIINDVTGMTDPQMVRVVADYGAACIVSHLAATDVQAAHRGELIDDAGVVVADLLTRVTALTAAGLPVEQIILDPGIGFGKTPRLNEELLSFAKHMPDFQVMIGYSRKRFLGDDRMQLAPNLEAGRVAIAAGAAYLRVHDVAGHQQLLY